MKAPAARSALARAPRHLPVCLLAAGFAGALGGCDIGQIVVGGQDEKPVGGGVDPTMPSPTDPPAGKSLVVSALVPANGPGGSVIEVRGQGFEKGDLVTIVGIGNGGSSTLTPTSITASSLFLAMPKASPGEVRVLVQRGEVKAPAAGLPFTITAGKVFYLATNGNDAWPGGIDQPWKTLDYATDRMAAGDLLYVRGGTYPVAASIHASGQDGAPLTITGYPGESALFSSPAKTPGSNLDTLSVFGSYVTITHLRFSDQNEPGQAVAIATPARYVTVAECEIYGAHGQGIIINGDQNVVFHNRIHDNGSTLHLDHGVYVEGGNNLIRNNIVWNNYDNGIQVYNEKRVTGGNVIEGNYAFHNGYGTAQVNTNKNNAGILVAKNQPNTIVRNNKSCDNANYGYDILNNPNGSEVSGNVSCFNRHGGFASYGPGSGTWLANNISYNDRDFSLALLPGFDMNSDNNVFFTTGGAPVLQWNWLPVPLAQFKLLAGLESHSRIEDPHFANLPAKGFDLQAAFTYDFGTPLNPDLPPTP